VGETGSPNSLLAAVASLKQPSQHRQKLCLAALVPGSVTDLPDSEAEAEAAAWPIGSAQRVLIRELGFLSRTSGLSGDQGSCLRADLMAALGAPLQMGEQPCAGRLLGAAAAQMVRLDETELLALILTRAAHTVGVFGGCQGRDVAELLAAAEAGSVKVLCFLQACSRYCASPPSKAFSSLQEVTKTVVALVQLCMDIAEVDLAGALYGLATAAESFFDASCATTQDLADFTYGLAKVFDLTSQQKGSNSQVCRSRVSAETSGSRPGHRALYELPGVCAVFRTALGHMRRRLHLAASQDAVMAAGAVAKAWPLLRDSQDSTLRPCLLDVVQLARFRHADFGAQDLVRISVALASVSTSSDAGFDALLEERLDAHSARELSSVDLCELFCAIAHMKCWSKSHFASVTVQELRRRDLSQWPLLRLCAVARASSKLAALGQPILRAVTDEAFSRTSFSVQELVDLVQVLVEIGLSDNVLHAHFKEAEQPQHASRAERTSLHTILHVLRRSWPSLGRQRGDDEQRQEEEEQQLVAAMQLLETAVAAGSPWLNASPGELRELIQALRLFSASLSPNTLALLHAEVASSDCAGEMQSGADDLGTSARGAGASTTRALAHRCSAIKSIPGLSPPPGLISKWEDRRHSSLREQEHGHGTAHQGHGECGHHGHGRRDSTTSSAASEVQEKDCSCCGHSLGHGHGHGHWHGSGHSHGHGHEQGDDHGHEEHEQGHGDVHSHEQGDDHDLHEVQEQGHGHSHSRKVRAHRHKLEAASVSSSGGSTCASEVHCPDCSTLNSDGHPRLNLYCDFPGHCVKLKNTFLHIPCNASDSESEQDCVVCRLTRSRSCDAVFVSPAASAIPRVSAAWMC